jgi:hypothetical protein
VVNRSAGCYATWQFGQDSRRVLETILEASTESEWVAQHLETLGHDVVVADPNYAPMYGQRSRRVKTDQRDVAALTEACQRGIYRVVHRRSAPQRTVQAQLNLRRELTGSRTRAISLTRAIIRGAGSTRCFPAWSSAIRWGATGHSLLAMDELAPENLVWSPAGSAGRGIHEQQSRSPDCERVSPTLRHNYFRHCGYAATA